MPCTAEYSAIVAHNPDRASYFPAIEAKHGQPMTYWFDVMSDISDRKYDEQIAFLRDNHGFSRAHANALVLYSRGSTSARKYDTYAEYLETLDGVKRTTMERIFTTLKNQFPELDLVIAWNQPMLKMGKSYLFGASASKNHLTIAPWDAEVLEEFRPRLTDYVVNKKTIRVPADWDVDEDLLIEMMTKSIARVE